ncbi:MAG: ATP synthase F1 subunit delta [Acidobacteriota bacterium]
MAGIANRYARALLEVSFELGQTERIERELQAFENLLVSEPDLPRFYADPSIAASKKRAATREILNRLEFSPAIRNFLFVLIDKARMGLFSEICRAFRAELNERRGILRAEVTTAVELGPAVQSQLQRTLEDRLGKKMEVRFAVDAELIGGVVTRVGDTIYDGSIRQQLALLREQLSSE